MTKLSKIAIIGRANVGKSTLFNCLTEKNKAIISNIPGTTRDRNYAPVEWRGFAFELVDTGGLDIVHDKAFEEDVIKQATFALNEAGLILFVVDAKNGLMPQDKQVVSLLKKSRKQILLVANKVDGARIRQQLAEFYRLGLGDPIPVSALNGTGTGDLLDLIVDKFKQKKPVYDPQDTTDDAPPVKIKVAIIGKPNVGKSSIVNSILGEERVITSSTPYTTRDSQDIEFKYQDQNYLLIDTAGIRKRNKIKNKLERFSVKQSLISIKRAEVALLVTDVTTSLSRQDKILSEAILESEKSVIIIANKWDLVPDKDEVTINKYIKYYQAFFPYLTFAPIVFTSALEGQRVKKILEVAKEVYDERFREISENALDKFIKKVIKIHPPAKGKGTKKPKIHGLKQLKTDPPIFELIKDYKSDLHISYIRFIENKLREKFGFLGTPIIIKVRKLKG
jgi:GTP-binding protein